MKQIDKLIINPPYEEPKYYWHYDREHRSFEKREGRRPTGYVVATPDSKGFDDPGALHYIICQGIGTIYREIGNSRREAIKG